MQIDQILYSRKYSQVIRRFRNAKKYKRYGLQTKLGQSLGLFDSYDEALAAMDAFERKWAEAKRTAP